MNESKVLGFISMAPGRRYIFCDGDSCIVAGSEKAMREFLVDSGEDCKKYTITKARYGRVFQAMLRAGAAYSFDFESYARFRPLAIQDGFDPGNFSADSVVGEGGEKLLLRVERTFLDETLNGEENEQEKNKSAKKI